MFEPAGSSAAQIGLHFILGQFALSLRGRFKSTLRIAIYEKTLRCQNNCPCHR